LKILLFILIFYFSIVQTIFSQHCIRGIVRDYDSGDIISEVGVFIDTFGYYSLNKISSYPTYSIDNPKKLKNSLSDKSGAFQIDSIYSKKINLVLKGGKFYPFVIENIILNKLVIDLGEIYLLKGRYNDPQETPTMIYKYMGGDNEIQLPYPVVDGIRKKIKIRGIYVIMDYNELMRKKKPIR
jgi:hypothetical protein